MPTEPVNVVFYSTVVKRAAVDRKFLGGSEQFDRAFQPMRGNADLSLLASMAMDDARTLFGKLEQAGLVSGEDLGLVDMYEGVLIPCHGIRATVDEQALLDIAWAVQADESYRYGPEDVVLVWEPVAPPEPAVPQETKGTPWVRHAPRGGGLVHWTGGDEEEEEETW